MAETIQEFLVKIGYKVDEAGQSKFFNSLKKTETGALSLGKSVGAFGIALAGIGYAAAKGTLAYAKSMEQLYFAAKRTGTSIQNLKAIQLAGASLGASPESAQASVENLASFLRHNPGGDGFLESFGVKTKDKKGKELDTVEKEKNISTAFQKMPEWQAMQYGGALGMSDEMILAMRNPAFTGQIDKYKKAEGADVNAAGESAHKLEDADRLLESHKFGLAAQAMTPVMNTLTTAIGTLDKKLDDNTSILSKLVQFLATNSAMGNIAKDAGVAGGAYLLFKKLFPSAVKAIPAVAEAIPAVAEGAAGVAVAEAGASAAGAVGTADAAAAAAALVTAAGVLTAATAAAGSGLMLYSAGLNKGEDKAVASTNADFMTKQRGVVGEFEKNGLLRSDAIAMTANFTRESALNPRSIGDNGQAYGLGQWHPDRQAEFAKQFGHTMQESKDPMAEEVKFAAWELQTHYKDTWKKMKAAKGDERLEASIVSKGYERPRDTEGEAAKRAQIAQNISTVINVTGNESPHATANAVAAKQAEVQRMAARNSTGSFR